MALPTISLRDPQASTPITDDELYRGTTSVLRQGWNSGLKGVGSQLNSVAGLAGEVLGADEFAQNRNADALRLREEAAALAPTIGKWSQVNGLRDFGDYAAGLIGGSAPVSLAGIGAAAATGGGAVPAMLAAGAVNVLPEMGDVIQKQQADPEAMRLSAGERLGSAALGGLGSAAFQGVVPGLVGGKLMGQGAQAAARQSFKGVLAKDVLGASALEGVAEGGGDVVKQYAANPNAAIDWESAKENAIGGAVAGGAMGSVGAAGDLTSRVGPQVGNALSSARTSIKERISGASDAAAESPAGKKVKSAYDDVAEMVEKGRAKFDDTVGKMLRGEELGVDPAEWAKATTDEAKARLTALSDSEGVKAATKWAKEMLDDAGLDAGKRQEVADAMANVAEKGGQMAMAGLRQTWEAGKKAGAKINRFADSFSAHRTKNKRADVDVESSWVDEPGAEPGEFPQLGAPAAAEAPKKSMNARREFIDKMVKDGMTPDDARAAYIESLNEPRRDVGEPPKYSMDDSGAREVVMSALESSGLSQKRPELFSNAGSINTMASGLLSMVSGMTRGKLSTEQISDAISVFGDATSSVMTSMRSALLADANPAETEAFFKNLNEIDIIQKRSNGLYDTMRRSFTEEAQTTESPGRVEEDARLLIAHARGQFDAKTGAKPTAEQAYMNTLVNDFYVSNFGDKADLVRAAVEAEAAPAKADRVGAATAKEYDEYGQAIKADDTAGENSRDPLTPKFDENGNRLEGTETSAMKFGLSKPDTKGNSKSALNGAAMLEGSKYAKQHLLDLKAAYPDQDVRFEKLPGSEYGHIVVEQRGDASAFNAEDLAAMALDTKKFPNSPSRINIGGYVLDAVKVAKFARNKMQDKWEGDAPTTKKQRLIDGFLQGVAQLEIQFGKIDAAGNVTDITNISNDAVIGFVGGKPLTWGEAQKVRSDTAEDRMSTGGKAKLAALRAEFKGATAKDKVGIIKEVRDLVAFEKDRELTADGDTQERSLPRAKAAVPGAQGRDASAIRTPSAARTEQWLGDSPRATSMRKQDRARARGDEATPYEDNDSRFDKDGVLTKEGARMMLEGDFHGGVDINEVAGRTSGKANSDGGAPAKGEDRVRSYERGNQSQARREVGLDENIHLNTAANGDEPGRTANMDGSGQYVQSSGVAGLNTLAMAVNELWSKSQSAGAKSVTARAKVLIANAAMMTTADVRRLQSLAPEPVKGVRDVPAASVADAAPLINELARKYKDQIVAPGVKAESVKPKAEAPKPKSLMAENIAKRQEYLDNPPADYSTEKAKGIIDWATTQAERVSTEYEKAKGDGDRQDQLSDMRAALKRLVTKAKAVIEGDESLKDFEGGTPDPKSVAAKKAAFLSRAASGDKALLAELSSSTDAKGLQRAAEALPAGEALDTINARLSELVQDEDVAYGLGTQSYSNESTDPAKNNAANPQPGKDIKAYIEKVLGKSVKLAWAKFTHAGEFQRMKAGDIIRLSVFALNPMSTAYHESLHAFIAQLRDAGAHDVIDVLYKAARAPQVLKQLNEIYKDQPAVLDQLKDPEERVAYMYQVWASGSSALTVGPTTRNVFQKMADFIRSVLGIWSNDERALHIMRYFNDGSYAQSMGLPNATHRALMDPGRNKAIEMAKTFTVPLGKLADALLSTGDARLRDTNIPALNELADLIKRSSTEQGGDQGYIPAARLEATKRMGAMAEALAGYSPEDLQQALQALQTKTPATTPEAAAAVVKIKAILRDTKNYMEFAGVKLGDLGPDYFPRVWDTHYVSQNEQALRDMLEPYVRSGEFKGNPSDFIRSLTSRAGNEFGIETSTPGMQFKKKRELDFLEPADVAPFLEKDLMGVMVSYISQATRRAEWDRRLGQFDEDTKETKLMALMRQAKAQGASTEQLNMTTDYLKGVDGTLGDSINPHARRIMGNMIVYQNVRLLPMAMFSMLIDPMGVLVRGGTVGEAFKTFKRGMTSIPETYGRKTQADEATKLAELVGVIDTAVLNHVMGDVYTQGMVGGTAKKINNMFFKYNMVEGLNRSFRVGASEAAMSFIARHADLKGRHSKRWMAELGLVAGDVVMVGNRIALTQAEGLTPSQERRVHAAINQWVDGAMLRPDAADKPIWMNDPHYALISHLKQFVFSFQKTILNRMVHELKHGNYAPAMALASYVPMMIAADTAKGLIQNGGDEPEWKKSWGVAEYVGYGVQRAGLLGVGQFGLDVVSDAQRGGSGIGALAGPTLEQMADAVQLLGGRKQFGPMLLDAMPANALYKDVLGGDSDGGPMRTG